MKTFNELKKNLKKSSSDLKSIKLALLGDSATQFLHLALKGTAVDEGFNLEIFEADFDQIEIQIFEPNSDLYKFRPAYVLLYFSSHVLLNKYNKVNLSQQAFFADEFIDKLKELLHIINSRIQTNIICYNFSEIDDQVYGNFSNKVKGSFVYQIRKLNLNLAELAQDNNNLYVADLSALHNQLGKKFMYNPTVYINAGMVLGIDALPEASLIVLKIIASLEGKIKKCLILDLDNTLWGGVIGDDGLQNIQIGNLGIGKAFSELQLWIKKLKNRGIILAVCSNNFETVAQEPFLKHPEMVLKLDDFAVFVANWDTKVDKINYIQSVLNIGFDSMVFLDDNPIERNLIRTYFKDICVPELPEDPAEYLSYLYAQHLFETVSNVAEDAARTKQYQQEAQRIQFKKSFENETDFLESLNLQSCIKPFDTFTIPRVAQLTQRSNQFNLRTQRYTESDIEQISHSDNHFGFSFNLTDCYGDNGIIAVLVLKKESNEVLFIDTWLMSCRVLNRGMEKFTLNFLVEFAKENGFKILKGEYIPTPKNQLVKEHYNHLGFTEKDSFWYLEVNNFVNLPTPVKLINK